MAGGYKHCTNEKNEFIGIDLLDNMGDAHEALEQMFWMIQYLSGGDQKKIEEALSAFYNPAMYKNKP